jgi:hypothetical protein
MIGTSYTTNVSLPSQTKLTMLKVYPALHCLTVTHCLVTGCNADPLGHCLRGSGSHLNVPS